MSGSLRKDGIVSIIVLVGLLLPTTTQAGDGHVHQYAAEHGIESSDGHLLIANDAIANLGIQTIKLEPRTKPIGVKFFGSTVLLPQGRVAVSAPTSGALSSIVLPAGSKVRRGETIALFTPFQMGASQLPLVAPRDGVIGGFEVGLGAGVQQGQQVFSVINPSAVAFEGTLTRSIAATAIQIGMPARVNLLGQAEALMAKVYQVERGRSQGTGGYGTLMVEISSSGAIPLGLSGEAFVETSSMEPALLVPRSAVLGDQARQFVFVRRGNRFERKVVLIDSTDGDLAKVKSGLVAGDEVVVRGNYQLQFARSDAPGMLTTGKHEGLVARCSIDPKREVFAELKLHDDKGDLELWLTSDREGLSPYGISLSEEVRVELAENKRSVTLKVRDTTENKDEDGVSHLKSGRADYFIYPGTSGDSAAWLSGISFIDEARVSFSENGDTISCEWVTLLPHSHAESHQHPPAEHEHENAGHDHHGHSH